LSNLPKSVLLAVFFTAFCSGSRLHAGGFQKGGSAPTHDKAAQDQAQGGGSSLAPESPVENWVLQLSDPSLSDSQKWDLGRSIVGQGKAAFRTLIKYFKDEWIIGSEFSQGGECINPPPHLPIPERCKFPSRQLRLGERCEQLLYQIITPPYTSAYSTRLPAKDAPGPYFVIKDFKKWWEKYQNLSLPEIHEKARQLINQFWLRGYAKGPVEWK
jgi:hypothetical protein